MKLDLPPRWIFSRIFEECMLQHDPHGSQDASVEIHVPTECKVSIQAALLLASLINQLSLRGQYIILSFDSTDGAYSYLSRMGFFEHLDPAVDVRPERPIISGAMVHGGGNRELVEIHEVPPGEQYSIRDLPLLLAGSLTHSLRDHPDADTIQKHLATVLSEVLDNVYQHSGTVLPGLVALQPYKNASQPKVMLSISDSGYGITRTLREAQQDTLRHMTETEIIVKVFQEGLSRFGAESGRGGGLRRCAEIAFRYGADLHVRVPTAIVHLVPGRERYQENRAYCHDNVPMLWGTHLCFEFQLTR
jgi:hypothetical protein